MWVICGYERDGEQLVVEVALREADPHTLRAIWGLPDNDPLYDCYAVTPRIARELIERFDLRLEDDRLDYFLEHERDGPSLLIKAD